MTVERLYPGDERLANVAEAIRDELYKRCEGMPLPAIIGVLDILKMELWTLHRGE